MVTRISANVSTPSAASSVASHPLWWRLTLLRGVSTFPMSPTLSILTFHPALMIMCTVLDVPVALETLDTRLALSMRAMRPLSAIYTICCRKMIRRRPPGSRVCVNTLEAAVAEAAEGAITAAALEEGTTVRMKASFRTLPATITIVVDTHMADTADSLTGVDMAIVAGDIVEDMAVEEAVASAPIVLGRCLDDLLSFFFSLFWRQACMVLSLFVVPSLHLHALYVVCNLLY
mmetsp:Transcript_10442/g.15685  ORF Transcript_10442/g.15685 Transcript_10442/m.15685 type:complete len:232 (+) Transcript_10442:1352-2047(+)